MQDVGSAEIAVVEPNEDLPQGYAASLLKLKRGACTVSER